MARTARSLAFVLVCLVSLELTARLYWRLRGVPFTEPARVLQAFYPGLREIDERRARWNAAPTRVLLLGGSTLSPRWGNVQAELREQLMFAGFPHIRIFNLGAPGLTSRDSRLEYEALGRERFDLVVVYDGINEARANNVAPDLFRDDYEHYGWYESVNALARHHGQARWALPYTLEYLGLGLRQLAFPSRYIPRNRPHPEVVGYGSTVRSAGPFEANLRAILARAASRGEPVLLMTFAIWVPRDYSLERFQAGQLGYGTHVTPLELWGEPEHVQRAVAAHNEVVRALAREYPAMRFVDQAALLAEDRRSFNDPCHLTLWGAHRFVENLLPAAVETLRQRQPAGPAAALVGDGARVNAVRRAARSGVGGPAVLQRANQPTSRNARALHLPEGALAASWKVWTRYGNVSSATALFILSEIPGRPRRRPSH